MKKVIVIGAGIAGLAAATKLAEAGCDVIVLEASDRVGGRIRTVHASGVPVEVGAEFVHGKPPELLALIDELGLAKYELGGERLGYSPDGTLHIASNDNAEEDDPFAVMEQMAAWSNAHPSEDRSFAAWLAQETIPEENGAAASAYVEGFNAADAGQISVRSLAVQQDAEDSIEGDTSFHVKAGYQAVPEAMVSHLTTERCWRRVAVETVRSAKSLWQQGKRACGVLQSGEMVAG